MTPFLKLVAQDLIARFGNDISNVTLVFPSRRAGLFFNTYLSKLIQKPIWSPTVVTITELMQQVTSLTLADPIKLVTNLYNTYCSVKGSSEPFENFYFWGEVMLADFDQVDKYLVDPKQLFSNIKDIKDIEEQFGGLTEEQSHALDSYLGVMKEGQVTELRKNYLSVWGIMFDIYTRFQDELTTQNAAYEGMIYRKAAQILANPSKAANLPTPIAFIGFNALNECEKALLQRCKQEGNALFYWDYDPSFLDNYLHEAGLFIRQNLQLFPNALTRDTIASSISKSKNIKMVAAPSAVAQTKLIPKILTQMVQEGTMLDISTAIVFPKENILLPALQAIPPEVEALNITMGYPIKETPAFSLAEFLVKLQINGKRNSEGIVRFYHRDVLAVLNHPYVRLCEPQKTGILIHSIKKNNRIYPQASELHQSELLCKIFTLLEDNEPIASYLLNICKIIAKAMAIKSNEQELNEYRIDLEFLYALHKSLTRVGGVLLDIKFDVTHRIFLQLLRKVFNQERVSFTGEPLSGLQIMGFLETRSLDFENIIILSFNDDVLPGRNHPVSFITPSLRIGFGLPNYKHHDAVYAYYFYRLLTRAKNIYLVYSGRAEGMSSGEKSRFGLQLEMEHMRGKVDTINVGYNLSITPPIPIEIDKTSEVINTLTGNLKRGGDTITLSPSGLTSYITCPLRFYFRYAVGIKEEDDIAEEVGALEFGNIIHQTMEKLYSDFCGKQVTTPMMKTLMGNPRHIENTLDEVFNEVFLKNSSSITDGLSGRNLLARNAMLYTLKKMLQSDSQRTPFNLISHEEKVYIQLENKHISTPVRLGGSIDRLEDNNGTIWSIDYKTGRHTDKGKFSEVADLFASEKVDKCKEVFQTFCYSLALTQT